MQRGERPFAGRAMLLTRPAGQGDSLAARLAALGARVRHGPTIAFGPPADAALVRRTVGDLGRYGWIVFTSPTGARWFSAALESAGLQAAGVASRIAAVGQGTARALSEAGFGVHVVARQSRAEGLADALGHRLAGERALWVRPEEAREALADALRAAGAQVDEVPFYRTLAAPGAKEVAEEVASGAFDAVVFSSPSTLRFLLESGAGVPGLRQALARTRRVAIGEITAQALAAAGLPADAVAEAASDEGIERALRKVLPA